MEKRQKMWIFTGSIVFVSAFLAAGLWICSLQKENRRIKERLDREIQQGIAGEVFRLHVVANSDTDKDQKLKLEVKEAVVAYLRELVGEDTTRDETKEAVQTHLSDISQKAEEIVKREGFAYPVRAVVEETYFPDKTYGDCTFPAGVYEALNVHIGEARGHNWWCVLYPALCFTEDTYGIVSKEKKGDLKTVLTEEEYRVIVGNKQEKRKVKIGFRWF